MRRPDAHALGLRADRVGGVRVPAAERSLAPDGGVLGGLALRLGVDLGAEEQQMRLAFGREYNAYLARVDRLIPFKKP